MLRRISLAQKIQKHSLPTVYFAKRCFSATSKKQNNAATEDLFSEKSMQERKEKAANVVKEFFQKEYAYVSKLSLTAAQAKEAAAAMLDALKSSDIQNIASLGRKV